MKIVSSAFSEGERIPARHTFEAEDVSPPLSWSDIPPETVSLALIVEDSDAPNPTAPQTVWLHWLLYNIPPTVRELPENAKTLPQSAHEGLNDWKRTGYFGPNSVIGTHRYVFRLYALDTTLEFASPPRRAAFEAAIAGHLLVEAALMGLYGSEHALTSASGHAQPYGARRQNRRPVAPHAPTSDEPS
ncbi:MAG: YbhB/YbcL family Raf kinase inhibitor-like protein [Alphaproteobacteria bacterium]|nr:YbhB/YbcL family Raf kinase inhibitor-like protein [Alphaproteobacteria bacterium]MBU6473744.1 YbhB/YbcL family Raf kinase inhibitor-like protein [Alphaproteobacteria bacterium]MDE2012096.1 YbhB/YbcL family Raf kinase inhibitor-like protein [Alphaproteobacteria bacterium]MDE2073393.1 YbhB/YbcL family Raf kinase inhibitor-like protein [Alphaproteobacteria bacterium]MDE2350579.1 YbhB/YbcL family Raf kinase inhibitor-like protein [Alphaproteobacteria bacterium]